MKKSLVAALTTCLVTGATVTAFAAANPFSDLPADHWAYDAVTQLAEDGIVEGYGDTTYRGDRNITRYEMAQMIAKLMARYPNAAGADKALLDRLAAEFSDELNNLGVRVANLERNADMVKWNGMMRYTYKSERHENGDKHQYKTKENSDTLKFRLEPTAEVNDHWHVKARLDADVDMTKDKGKSDGHVTLKRVYAQGDYRNFQVKFGKMGLYPRNQMGMILDDEFSGAEVTFGKVVKVTLQAGRLDVNDTNNLLYNGAVNDGRYADDVANFQAINIGVDSGKLSADVGYINLNTDNLKGADFSQLYGLVQGDGRYNEGSNNKDDAHIWYVDGRYQFTNSFGISAAYAQNTEADFQKYSWQGLIHYKGARKEDKGSWGLYTGYRREGLAASIAPSDDAIQNGQKGWEIGADYTIFKNVVGYVKYFRGKDMNVRGRDDTAQTLWGRVEFFF